LARALNLFDPLFVGIHLLRMDGMFLYPSNPQGISSGGTSDYTDPENTVLIAYTRRFTIRNRLFPYLHPFSQHGHTC